jgi:hypothetical protein
MVDIDQVARASTIWHRVGVYAFAFKKPNSPFERNLPPTHTTVTTYACSLLKDFRGDVIEFLASWLLPCGLSPLSHSEFRVRLVFWLCTCSIKLFGMVMCIADLFGYQGKHACMIGLFLFC